MNRKVETYKSYADEMKSEIKEMVDGIDAENGMGISCLKMIYGFVRRCMLNSKPNKVLSRN